MCKKEQDQIGYFKKYESMVRYILAFCFINISNLTSGQNEIESFQIDSTSMQYEKIKQANIEAAAKANIVHFVMKNEDGSYGYSIFIDGNLTYYQPNVPAISGNIGFVKVDHAEAAAKLAIQKIKQGESPPTLSEGEINKIIDQ